MADATFRMRRRACYPAGEEGKHIRLGGEDAPTPAITQIQVVQRPRWAGKRFLRPGAADKRFGDSLSGGPCRDRTCDLGIKSPLLYQLS
jgi:hypothetical protein